MKQSIFNEGVKESVFKRIDSLKPDSKSQWGKLNATQMVRHLFEANRMALDEIPMPDRSNFISRTLIKPMFLANIKPPGRKKGKVHTFPEIDIVEKKIAVEDLETEKKRYKNIVERIINTESLATTHTLFGKMSRADWGYLIYAHADYHLTQFNS